MQSVQKLNSQEEYHQITVKVWKRTYCKLKEMQKNPETSIVRLIDKGVTLLEKQGNHED